MEKKMQNNRIIVAGQHVADKIAALRAATVRRSTTRIGCLDSESLSAFQQAVSAKGYLEAEIVKSMYGYSLRYASGLQGFVLIYSAKQGQLDGTLESAIAAAQRWQAADPDRRWVTRVEGE